MQWGIARDLNPSARALEESYRNKCLSYNIVFMSTCHTIQIQKISMHFSAHARLLAQGMSITYMAVYYKLVYG